MDFSGMVIIVTGVGSGIGHACARKLLDAGANAIGFDTGSARIEHSNYQHYAVDVRCESDIGSAVTDVESVFGRIDGLVNCAGVFSRSKPFYDISADEWDTVIGTNLTGTFVCAKHVASGMRTNNKGKIVNISCIRSRVVKPHMADYAASKGGVVALTAAMAVDMAPFNVQVNSVAPGFTLTGMTKQAYSRPDIRKAREQRVPAGRIATPDDIADAVLFLLSEAADYITGETLFVDGGFTISEL